MSLHGLDATNTPALQSPVGAPLGLRQGTGLVSLTSGETTGWRIELLRHAGLGLSCCTARSGSTV